MNRRSGLGRGIGSLIPTESGDSESPSDLKELSVSAIKANEYQPRSRFEEESLVSLTDSIRELGVLQPILVRSIGDGKYELIAGERRWRAARRAGLQSIPAIVRDVDDKSSLEQAVVENLHREDLNALEEAAAYQQLIDEFGLTQEQVSTRVGRSRSAVSNTLRLFQLPGSIQRMVAAGDLSAGHARALLVLSDHDDQLALAEQIVSDGLSVRQVEEFTREMVQGPELPPEPEPEPVAEVGKTKPAALLELEELLGEHLDTRVTLSMGRVSGRMVVEFADLEDLERVYRAILAGKN